MASIKAVEGQSLFDVAIERLGSLSAIFDLAVQNGLSVTEELQPGQVIELSTIVDSDVSGYFEAKAVVVSTDGSDFKVNPPPPAGSVYIAQPAYANVKKVASGQSLFDVAIERLGSAEAAFSLAVENGLSVTDELQPGQELIIPKAFNKKVASLFQNRNIVPVTGVDESDDESNELTKEGIGYWAIGVDFVVS